MPDDPNPTRSEVSLGQTAFNTLLILALGCGIQTATAPTVIVSCPARRTAAPDCRLSWLMAFDLLPVRRVALTGLQSVDQIEALGGSSSSRSRVNGDSTFTFYFRSAVGRTRVIPRGD